MNHGRLGTCERGARACAAPGCPGPLTTMRLGGAAAGKDGLACLRHLGKTVGVLRCMCGWTLPVSQAWTPVGVIPLWGMCPFVCRLSQSAPTLGCVAAMREVCGSACALNLHRATRHANPKGSSALNPFTFLRASSEQQCACRASGLWCTHAARSCVGVLGGVGANGAAAHAHRVRSCFRRRAQ